MVLNAAKALPLDEKHVQFTRWAQEQGVEINGVAAAPFEARGIGIVATRRLEEGEVLLRIPYRALITAARPFISTVDLPGEDRVHARFAAAWAVLLNESATQLALHGGDDVLPEQPLGALETYNIWRSTWPSMEEMEESLPLCWPSEWVELLPPSTQILLSKQRKKFDENWAAFEAYWKSRTQGNPPSFESFRYLWMIINSRCFYWEEPPSSAGSKAADRTTVRGSRRQKAQGRPAKRQKRDADDCLALVPFADYFNHAATGCTFESNPDGCWITCDRSYGVGEEVVVSYGPHGNDMLLVEYGFTMRENQWDSVPLDKWVSPVSRPELWEDRQAQHDVLQERGYVGNNTLYASGEVCFRTEATLEGLIGKADDLEAFIDGQEVTGGQRKDGELKLKELLAPYLAEVSTKVEEVQKMGDGTMHGSTYSGARWSRARSAILARWQQIEIMLGNAMEI